MALPQHNGLRRIPASLMTIKIVSGVLNSLVEHVLRVNEPDECSQSCKRSADEYVRPAKRKCVGKKKCPTCKHEANGNRQHECHYCGYKWVNSRPDTSPMDTFLAIESSDPIYTPDIFDFDVGRDMTVEDLDYFFASIDSVPGDINDDFCDPFCLSWEVLSSSTDAVTV